MIIWVVKQFIDTYELNTNQFIKIAIILIFVIFSNSDEMDFGYTKICQLLRELVNTSPL